MKVRTITTGLAVIGLTISPPNDLDAHAAKLRPLTLEQGRHVARQVTRDLDRDNDQVVGHRTFGCYRRDIYHVVCSNELVWEDGQSCYGRITVFRPGRSFYYASKGTYCD